MKNICVIGTGRVGLTLALTLASAGFKVSGIEKNKEVVESLKRGIPHFYEKGLDALLKKHLNKNFNVSSRIDNSLHNVYIICVGTPVDKKSKKVIMEPLLQATSEVAEYIKDGDTVILRSTVPVGTTRNVVLPMLKQKCDNFHLAFCPERTIEGKALIELRHLPQIVGGIDEESVEAAASIFSKTTATIVRVESLEAAEMIKLIDNTYRDINFAFANEISLIAEKLQIDGVKLIEAANLGYSRNNVPVPGFVGGACLSKDPYIVVESSLKFGYEAMLPKIARAINENFVLHVANKLIGGLKYAKKDIRNSKILIAGLAFKGEPPNDDLRDSPALDFISYLNDRFGCRRIYGHDFVVDDRDIENVGINACNIEEGFKDADAAVFMNNHSMYYDLDIKYLIDLMNKPAVFIDEWRIFDPADIRETDGIIYGGLANDS